MQLLELERQAVFIYNTIIRMTKSFTKYVYKQKRFPGKELWAIYNLVFFKNPACLTSLQSSLIESRKEIYSGQCLHTHPMPQ